MPHVNVPIEGGCRCGRVRFWIDAPPLLTAACHCRGCQRMTGGAYSLTLGVTAGAFRLTKGEPVIGGIHGDTARHWHCDWCKSWVYTVPLPDPGFVNVRATMLDDPYWFTPFVEFETAEMLPFAQTGAPHSYARYPDMSEYPKLIAAYAESQNPPPQGEVAGVA